MPISRRRRDDRHRDRVVDEEQPNDQGNVGERRQVEVKRGKHPLDLPAPLRRALDPQPVRQPRRDRPLGVVDRLRVEQLDLHPIEPSQTVEQQLRRRDIHQGQLPVHDPRRSLIEQQATHDGAMDPVADDQLHRRVELDRMASGEPLGEHHRCRVEQQRQ